MTKTLSRFLFVFLFYVAWLLPVYTCCAQGTDTTSYSIDTTVSAYNEEDKVPVDEADSASDIEIIPIIRTIPADSIIAIKQNQAFFYMTYLDSLLRAEQKAKDIQPDKKIDIDTGPSLWDVGIVKLLCWLVAIGLVGFVLYKLFLGGGIFFSNKKQELPAVELEAVDNESDLEKALNQSIKKGDYRMATRYLFLITLSRLGEKGILQLSTEKTNYQYATELLQKPYSARFAQLSLQYEYVWFGGFTINEHQFAALQQQHQQFLKDI